jgi:RNA-binding protein
MELTGKQSGYLSSLAHHKDPIVRVGHAGMSEAVIAQIDSALETHELIKIKLGKECPVECDDAAELVQSATRGTVVQSIGRILVVYRRREEKPAIELPAAAVASLG